MKKRGMSNDFKKRSFDVGCYIYIEIFGEQFSDVSFPSLDQPKSLFLPCSIRSVRTSLSLIGDVSCFLLLKQGLNWCKLCMSKKNKKIKKNNATCESSSQTFMADM